MKRVRFNWVDFRAAASCDESRDQTEQQSTQARHDESFERVKHDTAREPFAGIKTEEKLVHESDSFAHGGDRKTCDDPDNDRQYDDTRFTRAHDRAQAVRYFEGATEQTHRSEFVRAGAVTGLNSMTRFLASASSQRLGRLFDCLLTRVFSAPES
jgi:hypothetical protein